MVGMNEQDFYGNKRAQMTYSLERSYFESEPIISVDSRDSVDKPKLLFDCYNFFDQLKRDFFFVPN
jgi:hypothetical protein